jgi:RNA polymerase sigma-70 factor (sigma-E family)
MSTASGDGVRGVGGQRPPTAPQSKPDPSAAQGEFAAYFTARRDAVRRTAYLLCGDWHFADDLTQMAFVRVAAGWRKVRDREALDAYAHTILIRTFLAEQRRWFRRRERTAAEVTDVAPTPASDTADAVSRRLAVAAALRRLPDGQRAVIVARFYADLDVAATADALGCSPGTVKSQTARAVRALREHLADIDLEVSDASA